MPSERVLPPEPASAERSGVGARSLRVAPTLPLTALPSSTPASVLAQAPSRGQVPLAIVIMLVLIAGLTGVVVTLGVVVFLGLGGVETVLR